MGEDYLQAPGQVSRWLGCSGDLDLQGAMSGRYRRVVGKRTDNHTSATAKDSRGAILTLQAPFPPLSLTHFFSYFLFIHENILQIFIGSYLCAGATGEVTPDQLPVHKSSLGKTCVSPFPQFPFQVLQRHVSHEAKTATQLFWIGNPDNPSHRQGQ